MNPWWWRVGVAAVGAGAATVGLRRWTRRLPAYRPRATADLFPEPTTIMGHRGAAAVAPENTLSGFGVAARLGLPFELDVRQCATGEVVVLHDETLERTTNGRGRISETPWSAVRTLDAGGDFAPAFMGQRVPSLDTVLATFGTQVVINVEIKHPGPGGNVAPLVSAVVELVQAHEAVDKVVISAAEPATLAAVRAADGRIRRAQIIGPPVDRSLYAQITSRPPWFSLQAMPDMLMIERSLVTSRYIARLKRLGFRVFAWTVNREDDARRLIAAGVDGLITDDPRRLKRVLT